MVELRAQRAWEDEDCVMFRETVRRFYDEWMPANDMRWRAQKHVDRELWNAAGEVGILTPSIPVEYGGSGGDYRFEAILTEELSYADSTSFIGRAIHGVIVAHYVLRYGSEEQKQAWLPAMATGEAITALGMTEPNTGSDLKAIRTTARRDGDDYVINGSKIFITNGIIADKVLLAVRTSDDPGSRAISLIMVDADSPGFSRGRNLDKIGAKGSDTAELFFDDVRVPASNVLGEDGDGFIMMMQQLPQERIDIAVGAQAMLERAIELTLEYVKERKAFGKPIGEFQNSRFKLAECVTEATVSRAFVDSCITKHIAGELDSVEASMAKYYVTDRLNRILDECVQLHGGYGYMDEYPVARFWADARVQRIYGGTNEIMKEIISRSF